MNQESNKVLIVHGETLIWRTRGGGKWVGVFDAEDAIHFFQPTGCVWRAQRPFALEPICTAKTLEECVWQIKRIRQIRRENSRKKVKLALASGL